MKKPLDRGVHTHVPPEASEDSKNSTPKESLLKSEDIEKFQALYKSYFGRNISKDEAFDQALKLLTLMRSVYKTMTANERECIDKHREESICDVITCLAVK